MLNNLFNSMALAMLVAIAAAAAFGGAIVSVRHGEPVASARPAASAPAVRVVELAPVEIVAHRDRTLAER